MAKYYVFRVVCLDLLFYIHKQPVRYCDKHLRQNSGSATQDYCMH